MILKNLEKFNIILASQSPRRHQMLTDLGLIFEIKTRDVEEIYPPNMKVEDIPVYLASLKADAFVCDLKDDELIITADTIVSQNGSVLGKPTDREDAYRMISDLAGNSHQVISGVCLISSHKRVTFSSTTNVHFKPLSEEEIFYYIDKFKPYDKAGAYGIQEWIGFVGVDYIEGSYFNVVGLPVQRLYEELKRF